MKEICCLPHHHIWYIPLMKNYDQGLGMFAHDLQFPESSALRTIPSPSNEHGGNLLPGLIFFTSWLEHI